MRVLLAMASRLEYCPRAFRLYDYLLVQGHEVDVLAVSANGCSVEIVRRGLLGKSLNLTLILLGRWRQYLNRKVSVTGVGENYDAVVCFDPILLPFVCEKLSARVRVFDAREYFPEQFSDRWIWRITSGRLWEHLLREHLSFVDSCVTVSNGIAELYQHRYGVQFSVIHSLCQKLDTKPSEVNLPIRAVHHGNSNRNRSLDRVIRSFARFPEKYSLDLYLVETDTRTLTELRSLARATANVRVLVPLPYEDLLNVLGDYDVGVFVTAPRTRNLQYSMPNKVFEYIQARLMLVVSPLEEVGRLVRTNALGVVLDDFSDAALERALENLTDEQVRIAKASVDRLALCEDSEDSARRYLALMMP